MDHFFNCCCCCCCCALHVSLGFLDWGWQAGCDFVGKTCSAYAAAHPGQQFFCTREQYSSDSVNTVCTFDGLARAQCAEAPFAEGCAMKVGDAGAGIAQRQRVCSYMFDPVMLSLDPQYGALSQL
jgi:hypothetical protein